MSLKESTVLLSVCLLSWATQLDAGTVILGPPVPLSNLIGGSIDVGDKIFSGFGYAANEDMPTVDAVNVIPIQDGDGNYGLRFQSGFQDLPGGNSSDALIVFDVDVMPSAGRWINDVHLVANLALIAGDGLATITETFLPDFPNMSLTVYDSGTLSQLTDWADLPELVGSGQNIETLQVQKDILLRADSAVAATLSFVDQTFSQVPEPSGLVLLSLGLLGVIRRR